MGSGASKTPEEKVAELRRQIDVLQSKISRIENSKDYKLDSKNLEQEMKSGYDDMYKGSGNEIREPSDAHRVNEIFDHADKHADKHAQIVANKRARAHRQTKLRLLARQQVKQTKALSKVPCFAGLSPAAVASVVDNMVYKKYASGDILCHQGAPATKLFVIVEGTCTVKIQAETEWKHSEKWVQVGELNDMDICGENALLMLSGDVESDHVRSATVTAKSDVVQTLELSRNAFLGLVKSKILDTSVMDHVRSIQSSRHQSNQISVNRVKESDKFRSISGSRLRPVSSMSIIDHINEEQSRLFSEGGEAQSKLDWKQRLDKFSSKDFSHSWRVSQSPDDFSQRFHGIGQKTEKSKSPQIEDAISRGEAN